MNETVRDCLSFDSRPETPPHIRKYRRSTNLEPGRRFVHPGVVDDHRKMHLDDRIYGIREKLSDRVTASQLINLPKQTELEKINTLKSEALYKRVSREPLGHSPDRKVRLPNKFTEEKLPFGVKSQSSLEPAKDLIFPVGTATEEDGSDLYKRSHGSYAPGEQRRRGYDWKIDPARATFGQKGDLVGFGGASTNVYEALKGGIEEKAITYKKVEDFRNMGDMLGQIKNLGQDSGKRPKDIVYGKPSGAKNVSAGEVIKGYYKQEDTAPDRDLGKSITPGFRNTSFADRAYGCPSIRSDIPTLPYNRRSLADSQNYGDDLPAQDLINPPSFADLSIGPLAMNEQKSKAKVQELFNRIGYQMSADLFDVVFRQASNNGSTCSINDFRDVLNEYLIKNDIVE